MKLKTFNIELKPEVGDYRIEKRFAWWPEKVENKLIWLERYKIISEYSVRYRVVYLQGFGVIQGTFGGWDLVTKQLIKK